MNIKISGIVFKILDYLDIKHYLWENLYIFRTKKCLKWFRVREEFTVKTFIWPVLHWNICAIYFLWLRNINVASQKGRVSSITFGGNDIKCPTWQSRVHKDTHTHINTNLYYVIGNYSVRLGYYKYISLIYISNIYNPIYLVLKSAYENFSLFIVRLQALKIRKISINRK